MALFYFANRSFGREFESDLWHGVGGFDFHCITAPNYVYYSPYHLKKLKKIGIENAVLRNAGADRLT